MQSYIGFLSFFSQSNTKFPSCISNDVISFFGRNWNPRILYEKYNRSPQGIQNNAKKQKKALTKF